MKLPFLNMLRTVAGGLFCFLVADTALRAGEPLSKETPIMGATIIAAIIAALAAALVGTLSLYATYRLKVKEFRVVQIKSRIDTLEQAAVFQGPESDSEDDKTEESQDAALRAISGIKAGAWHRLGATETQYRRYKWLLNAGSHGSIENLLEECNKRSSKLGADSLNPAFDRQQFGEDLIAFAGKTQDLRKAYEEARLSAIERLYFALKEEVGI